MNSKSRQLATEALSALANVSARSAGQEITLRAAKDDLSKALASDDDMVFEGRIATALRLLRPIRGARDRDSARIHVALSILTRARIVDPNYQRHDPHKTELTESQKRELDEKVHRIITFSPSSKRNQT